MIIRPRNISYYAKIRNQRRCGNHPRRNNKDNCKALKTINVPAKKADYYKSRMPEELHGLIKELPAEKKAKKK